jgi:hypothetical protein
MYIGICREAYNAAPSITFPSRNIIMRRPEVVSTSCDGSMPSALKMVAERSVGEQGEFSGA